MDPVVTECEACMGNRYNEEAMGCLYQGKNMVGLLALTASEAMEVFGDSPKILRHRKVMEQVGLSYLALGQLGGADLEATGRENLMLSGRLYGMRKDEVKQQSEQIMDLLELRDVMDRQAKTYSGGQRRRLEIGLGILHKPDVLFLDEPTAGLDPHNRANLWEHIRKLREGGMTVFLTTHYLEEADELCDRLCIMDRGVIVAEGTPQALKREISGDVVSIRLKGYLNDAARLLGGIHDVLDIRTEGENISLYVKDGAAALPEICNVLRENGEEAETLSLSQPSLDDVFLKQTGRSLRDTKRGGITI